MKYKILAVIFLAMLVAVLGSIHWRSTHRPAPKKPASAKRPPKQAPFAPAVTKKAALPKVSKVSARPRVAIVMDDLGYNANDLDELFGIGQQITLSILPDLAYSQQTADMAQAEGLEVIMHLPLEPKDSGVKLEPGTIFTAMDKATVDSLLSEEIASVPGIKGVSNHMGSKATEDKALMTAVMRYLKTRGLYFFDSLTSQKSVCREVAAAIGVRYARRDIFLDIPNDQAYIEKQMLALRKLAFARGSAIAVCHYRKNTISVLARMMPRFAEEGIVFVRLSEMVR